MDINFLLDKAKEECGVQMEKDLAKRLGVSPQAVSNYRKGRALPDPVVSATLAGLTGVPLARVLGIVGEARAISREEKAVWRKLAATAMTLAIGVGLASPRDVQAAVAGFDEAPSIHYAKSIVGRAVGFVGSSWQWLALWLGSCLRPGSPDKDEVAA